MEELRVVLVERDPELADIKPFTIRTAANGWSTARIETVGIAAIC